MHACRADVCRQGRLPCPCPESCGLPPDYDPQESMLIGARFNDGGAEVNTADAPPLPVSLQQPQPKQESAVIRFLRTVFTN